MKTYKSITLILLLISFGIQAQKLPKDALDSNTVLIFNPDASVDNNEETLKYFTESIIENGFNLVGKYLYTDTEISQKEIEFDMKNKEVKYVFLLTYKYFKAPDYDLFFYENDPNVNPEFVAPSNAILKLKPGFITSANVRGVIINKLKKEVDNLKSKNNDIDTSAYDVDLVNTLLLTEENIANLEELNERNTLVDGVTLTIENQNIPTDLKSNKLAIIGIDKEEYRHYKTLNSILKSQLKKYPFEYSYFEDYNSYLSDGGDKKYKYRLQLTKSSKSFLGMSKPRYTSAENYNVNKSATATTSLIHTTQVNYEKVLFSVVIKDNETNERSIVTERNFIKKSLTDFISQLK